MGIQNEPDYFSKQIHQAKRFYINYNPHRNAGVQKYQVIAGGRESCPPGYRISRKSFPFHAIEFITRGHGQLIISNNTWELKPGIIFFYSPGIPHEIRNDTEEPLEKYFINITGRKTIQLLDKYLTHTGRVLYTSASHSLIQTFEELIQYGLDHSQWGDMICSSLVEVLVFKIARYTSANGSRNIDSDAYKTFMQCWNYIGTHYRDIRTLASIAERCGITPSYLCRLFKEFNNQSPYQYLLRLQMNYAADRILKERIKIHRIAEQMGYKDPQHFTRTFKKIIGMSPSEFIQQISN